MTNRCKTTTTHSRQVPIRKYRIERWVHKETSSIQKSTESSFFQADRLLHMHVYQLGEQREKLIQRHNYDQKIFINKQALRHKDNESILSTLNYVRKCCKYFDMNDNAEESIDPTIFLEENSTVKTIPSRLLNTNVSKSKRNSAYNTIKKSDNPLTEIFLRHNKKHLESSRNSIPKKMPVLIQSNETPYDANNQQHHVQLQSNIERNIQSAHVSRKTVPLNDTKQYNRNVTSAHGLHTYPLINTVNDKKEPIKPLIETRPSPKRLVSSKSSLQEFRHYPERFLSKSNRYLPLLHRQSIKIKSDESYKKQEKEKTSLLIDGSDLAYDDAKSFLSEDIDTGKFMFHPYDNHNRKIQKKFHIPNKIDLMETAIVDTSERTMALARLRDREYAHLQKLIHSKSIEKTLEPFSTVKTLENNQQKSRCFNEILNSIDSLNCSTTLNNHQHRQIEIERNRSKLGILIF